MILIENRKLADGSTLEIQHVIKEHKAKLIKQIPGTKRTYRVKNAAGGVKCMFTQSKEYKRKPERGGYNPGGITGGATKWHGFGKQRQALELQAELEARG